MYAELMASSLKQYTHPVYILAFWYIFPVDGFESLKSVKFLHNNLHIAMLFLEGMQQEYFLGEILRRRYVEEMKLLHHNYTRVEVLYA